MVDQEQKKETTIETAETKTPEKKETTIETAETKTPEKKETTKKEVKETEEIAEKAGVELIFTIPLRKAKSVPRWKRGNKAIKTVKAYLARHLKADESNIHIDSSINEKIWSQGSQKPPLEIRVKAMKFEDGVVEAELIKD